MLPPEFHSHAALMKTTSKSKRRTRVAAAGLLLSVVVLFAHQYLPSQISNLAHEAIRSLHGPGFGVVALAMMLIMRSGDHPTSAYIRAAVFATVLAAASEAAQILGPREPQISDFLADALGILAFLGIAAILDGEIRGRLGKWRVFVLAVIGIPALVLTLQSTIWLSYALAMRAQAVPQILSFDESWEQTYSSGVDGPVEIIPAPDGWPEGSGNIARLHSAGRWYLMLHIFPDPDWSNYSAVSFIASTSNEFSREISIGLWGITPGDGSLQGRYYTRTKVFQEPARFCVFFEDVTKPSAEREFDLAHVFELLIGADSPEIGVQLLVDDFRLEKDGESCPSR